MTVKSICVFCGSSLSNDPDFSKSARRLGTVLAEQGITLVYGGASVGLMGVVADASLEMGGRVIGVIPEALFGKEVAHPGLTELHRVDSMHERKKLMYELSAGFVALPGGLGTLEEIFEILTWSQLGLHQKPCGFLNINGYYDPILQFVQNAVDKQLVKAKHQDLILVADSPEKLLKVFKDYHPHREKRWMTPEEV